MKNIYRILLVAFCLLTIDTPLSAQWKPTNGPSGGEFKAFAVKETKYFTSSGTTIYSSSVNDTNWTVVNTGLPQHEISKIIVDGSNIYACSHGGFLKSNDNGITWAWTIVPHYDIMVSDLAISESFILAAMMDGKCLRSTNGGTDWSMVNTESNTLFRTFAVKGNIIYAGTSQGLFLSSDFGISWTRLNMGTIYAEILSLAVQDSNIYVGTSGKGIFYSNNNGSSWQEINTGLPTINNDSKVQTLTVNGAYLIAGINNYGAYLSVNNGANWAHINQGIPLETTVFSLMIIESNCFAATSRGLFSSNDYGLNWNLENVGNAKTYVASLVNHKSNLFAGTMNNGVLTYNFDQNKWIASNSGITSLYIKELFVKDSILFASTSDGVYISMNNSNSWFSANTGLPDDCRINTFASGNSQIFAGTNGYGLFYSVDNGATWLQSSNGLLSNASVEALAIIGTTIFAGTNNGLYISTDNGNNWVTAFNGLPATISVTSLIIHNSDIFVATYYSGVYRSSDNGASWTAANTGFSGNKRIRSFTSSGVNLFAGIDGGKVFHSKDYGISWLNVSDGLPTTGSYSWSIKSLTVKGNKLFAGTADDGVWSRPLTEMVSNSVSGLISENTTWSDSVKVVGNITISDGVQLDIQPGTKIVFAGNYDITVKGRINALGTADRKIKFSPNSANAHWQGILYPENIDNDSSTYNHCIFQNSQSSGNGGVFNVQKGNRVVVADCVAEDNKSFNNGGFICANQSNIVIVNSAIRRNFAQMAGGALYLENCTQTLINNTFNNNLALSTGGAIVFNNTDGNVFNSIFWANSAVNNSQISLTDNNSDPNFYNNNIQGGILAITGDGSGANFSGAFSNNIDSDPQFANDSYGYNLSSTSPCINKGLQSKEKLTLPISDINGNPRIVSGNVDIGANEFNPTGIYNNMNIYDCELEQNYPNPFNPETVISYSIKEGFNGLIKLKIYNTKGEIVQTIINNVTEAGHYSQVFNGSKLSSGIYYYGIEAGDFKQMKKMVMVK